MIPNISRNRTCKKCEANIGEIVEQEVSLCNEMETVGEFAYNGDRVINGE